MNVSFYLGDVTYDIVNNSPRVKLYGWTKEGKRVVAYDRSLKPFFYVQPNQEIAEKLRHLSIEEGERTFSVIEVQPVEKVLNGQTITVLKVVVNVPPAVPRLREIIKGWDAVRGVFEADILFARRYLIDNNLTPMMLCSVNGTVLSESPVLTVEVDSIQQQDDTYRHPKILAVDIETYSPFNKQMDFHANPILMIALCAENYRRVFVWKKFATSNADVEFVDTEEEMIRKFVSAVNEFQPDILAGYFSDGFDLPYIRTRADKYNIKLPLGIDGAEPKLKTGNEQAVQIVGLPHFDVFKFVKRVMRGSLETEAFSLDAVSKELLGATKEDVDLSDLPRAWDQHDEQALEQFAQYNLKDTDLALQLAQKMLPSVIELVRIVGLPMYDINRMGFSQMIEWFLLKQSQSHNQLAPNKPSGEELAIRREKHVEGAFVFEPTPGFYKNLVVYDYLSLYPTIISSHNLGPGTLVSPDSSEEAEQVPGQPYRYSKERKGFLPLMINHIISSRLKIKEAMKTASGEELKFLDAQQGALKLLANSFYGYLGFYGARWYSKESAESTTAWGRHYITSVIDKAKEQGFHVCYGDTDSFFVELGDKSVDDAQRFVNTINKDLPGIMELEFEGHYPTGIFVSSKATESGAKKKYALSRPDGSLKIRGFETVRRNWAYIAKETQEHVLRIVLVEQDIDKAKQFAREVVDDLRNKKTPVDKLVIRMQLVKELHDYAAKGPHVAVAQQLAQRGEKVGPGTIISYVITPGSDVVRDRAKLPDDVKPGEYDAAYYVDHQVVPAVDRIFAVLGISTEELTSDSKQQSLTDFFG